MDLVTDLPSLPEIAGRASGRMCCDPALGFADQSKHRAETSMATQIRCEAGTRQFASTAQPTCGAKTRNAFGWSYGYARGESNVFEESAYMAGRATGERDRFLDGCLKVQEDERLRLGRELHDSTGQLLLALRLDLAQLKRGHGTSGEDQLISQIEDTARRIDREIRSFAYLHYPAEFERGGLGESLGYLTRGFAARTGLKISFADLRDRVVESGPAALALLRVAQEALMNVHRHAHAVHVHMSLTLRDRLLELVIRDDGVGLPTTSAIAKSHGVGLMGMRHRIERLGGHFEVKRMKHGTKLIASVPLAA